MPVPQILGQRRPSLNYVWDVNTLEWAAMEQPAISVETVEISGPIEVTGPLTDDELRAADVKITLDGETVAATQSGTWSIRTQDGSGNAIASHSSALDVSIRSQASALSVDGSGVTQPVSATNLDIRDLSAAGDSVSIHGDVGVADQFDLTNANPFAVAIVDGNGDQITSFGGGTQYTEGDTDASITGTALLWEDAGDTLTPVSASKPLPVDITDASVAVTNAGLTELAAAINGSSQLDVNIAASGATVPVSNAGLTELAAAINGSSQLDVNIAAQAGALTVASHAVTNAGTFAVQVDGAALTALQLIDDPVATLGTTTYSETTTKGMIVGAVRRDADTTLVDTTNEVGPLQMDANGRLKVEAFSGEALPVTDNSSSLSVDWNGTQPVTGSGTATGALRVELPTNGTGVIATVTNVATIGTSVTPGTAASNLGKAEDAGHSSADVGVMLLGVRDDSPDTARADTDNDYVPLSVTSTGALRIAPPAEDFAVLANGPHVKKYYTNSGAVTDGIVWSPAAGKRWYVTDIICNVSAACTVTFEDDKAGGDEVVGKFEFAANSGFAHPFKTPWFSGEDAADLLVTTSAGNIYITITGYEI